jgi:hypothetical protein
MVAHVTVSGVWIQQIFQPVLHRFAWHCIALHCVALRCCQIVATGLPCWSLGGRAKVSPVTDSGCRKNKHKVSHVMSYAFLTKDMKKNAGQDVPAGLGIYDKGAHHDWFYNTASLVIRLTTQLVLQHCYTCDMLILIIKGLIDSFVLRASFERFPLKLSLLVGCIRRIAHTLGCGLLRTLRRTGFTTQQSD